MGYLDRYGEGVERRLRVWKRAAAVMASILIAGGAAWLAFGNYRQERQAKRFFELLAGGNYDAAYASWVRTEADRRAYPRAAFLEDWGPSGGHGDPAQFRIAKSRSCGSGVVVTVTSGRQQERLWVERQTLVIGFAPPPDGLPRMCGL